MPIHYQNTKILAFQHSPRSPGEVGSSPDPTAGRVTPLRISARPAPPDPLAAAAGIVNGIAISVMIIVVMILVAGAAMGQHAVIGIPIADSGQFACDGQQMYMVHKAERELRIRHLQVWMGMSRNGVADFWFWVHRSSDHGVLGLTNWDHYGEPTSPHDYMIKYSPDYIRIEKGEEIVIRYGCQPLGAFAPKSRPVGHVTVTIWVEE